MGAINAGKLKAKKKLSFGWAQASIDNQSKHYKDGWAKINDMS